MQACESPAVAAPRPNPEANPNRLPVRAARRLGAVLHLYDTATREVRELALREPGKVSIYLCGPTVYGPPHLGHGRATLVYDVLRRYLEWYGLGRAARVERHRHRRQDHQPRRPRGPAVAGHHAPSARRCGSRRWTAINVERPTDVPHATEYVDEMVEMIGELVEHRSAPTSPTTACTCRCESVEDYGLLAHQSLDDMLAGRRRARGLRRRPEASSGRLRAVEVRQAGRAVVAVAVGRGPARLAQRVRGDEPRPARRGLRPALRRPGPALPAPRERARPGGRARQALRQPLDAPRLRRRRRGREDVEEPRQRRPTCST